MIEIVEVNLTGLEKSGHHSRLAQLLDDGYQIVGHSSYVYESRHGEEGEFIGDKTPMERYTLYKAPEKVEKIAATDLVLSTLVSAQRDQTSNNARPMWRCKTDDGEKVNVFLNTDDEKKDSFHLFEQSGWGEDFQSIELHEIRKVSIQIAMSKTGQFWEVRIVRQKPESDMPDWARESYLFDEIVTEDNLQEGGES